MPPARPPLEPQTPHPLREDEIAQIKTIISRFYGDDAVIRNFGPDPNWLQLHVESSRQPAFDTYDHCMGQLLCRIERQSISLTIRQRGTRIRGNAKIAYRQGVII